jgi:hypothetical protein
VQRSLLLLLFALVVLLPQGCGRSGGPALGKVSGAVSFRGKAIENGTLIIEVRGARTAYGKIVGGKITEVTTYKSGDGAPLGPARIAVFATEPDVEAGTSAAAAKPANPAGATPGYLSGKSLIPAKYNDPATSGLTYEIAAGENRIVLDLQ